MQTHRASRSGCARAPRDKAGGAPGHRAATTRSRSSQHRFHSPTPFIRPIELLGTCAKSPDRRNCRAKGSAMKINAIDIRPGFVLENGGKLMLVLKREIVQPGKGGAFTQIEMCDIKTGTKTIERYRTQETVERATLEEKEMQFLYMDGNHATFM